MKLTIEHEGIKATIESDAVVIQDAWAQVFYPALITAGYSHEVIANLLRDAV